MVAKKNQKTTTFFVKKVDKKTTPFRIHNSVFMGLLQFIKNNFAIFNYAFSYALKNQFEIISQSDYGFCYKNYSFNLNQVFRNNYDFCESFGRNSIFGFGKNNFGNCNFGSGFWNKIYDGKNNLEGFLFNRKNQQKNLIYARSTPLAKEKKR